MAAGAGLTAAADATITATLVGKASGTYGYAAVNTNFYASLFSTQFTASTKAGATEWTVASDGSYARQALGAAGAGWTVAAYVNGTGVVFNNLNQITFPAVTLNNQTLNAVGFNDGAGPTGGNINLFADLASPVTVNTTVQVIMLATTGVQYTTF